VNVSGQLDWQLKVDNCLDFLDIESSCGQISRQHVLIFSLLEIEKSLDSLSLTQITVQLTSVQSQQSQNYGDSMALLFGLEEHDDFLSVHLRQD
jgi:hypothetical protein